MKAAILILAVLITFTGSLAPENFEGIPQEQVSFLSGFSGFATIGAQIFATFSDGSKVFYGCVPDELTTPYYDYGCFNGLKEQRAIKKVYSGTECSASYTEVSQTAYDASCAICPPPIVLEDWKQSSQLLSGQFVQERAIKTYTGSACTEKMTKQFRVSQQSGSEGIVGFALIAGIVLFAVFYHKKK